jgi:hypothetical protein
MSRWFDRLNALRAITDLGQIGQNGQKAGVGQAFGQFVQIDQALQQECDILAERAAIVAANGIPDAWAETFAKLDAMPRPVSIRPDRWRQIVDDAGRFLDAWGRQAAAMGWCPVEAFHPTRGFVALIEGGTVTAITETTVAIIRETGCQREAFLCRLVALAGEPRPIWRVWRAACEPAVAEGG